MNSYPNQQQVLDDLGDKFVHAFIKAVADASADLADFRDFRPTWFVNFSKRFVANFIHERMWDSMTHTVAGHPDIAIVDEEPTRQIHVGTNYTIRFKRHSDKLKIRSFPTAGATAFWTNSLTTPTLPGLEKWTLAMGYIWDADLGEISTAILSFRDGGTVIWSIELHAEEGGEGAQPISWNPIEPTLPQLDLSDVAAADEDTSEGS